MREPKVAIRCASPLLQSSLERFLRGYIVNEEYCDCIITDEPLASARPVCVVGREIRKPFSGESLIEDVRSFLDSLDDLAFADGHSALRLKSAIEPIDYGDRFHTLSPRACAQSPDFSSQILECQTESSPKDSKEVSEFSRSESHNTSETTLSDTHSILESVPPVIASVAKQSIKQDTKTMDYHDSARAESRNDSKLDSQKPAESALEFQSLETHLQVLDSQTDPLHAQIDALCKDFATKLIALIREASRGA